MFVSSELVSSENRSLEGSRLLWCVSELFFFFSLYQKPEGIFFSDIYCGIWVQPGQVNINDIVGLK